MAKILLVEDEKKQAATIRLLLEVEQHKVVVAFDGLETEARLAACLHVSSTAIFVNAPTAY